MHIAGRHSEMGCHSIRPQIMSMQVPLYKSLGRREPSGSHTTAFGNGSGIACGPKGYCEQIVYVGRSQSL